MPGWTAVVDGQPQKVEHDGLGFMVLKTMCSDCRVTIRYNGGSQWRLTCLASLLVTAFGLAALAKPAVIAIIRRGRSGQQPRSDSLHL